MDTLKNKVALITGGTSGIGEAMSRLFASEGAEVIIVGRDADRGNRIVSEITKNGNCAEFEYCDVTDSESVNELAERVIRKHNFLDILVNNAGILLTSPFDETDEDDWMKVFDVNTHGMMRVIKAFIDIIQNNKGTILNNVSIDGLQSLVRGRTNYAYSASKAACIKMTQQLALNYTPKGIRVNCLCPGVTETPLFTNRDFSRFNSSIPMGRVGKPEEIAKAALFLVSDDASYISGAILTVDGGASLL